jgi:hypothetical protein
VEADSETVWGRMSYIQAIIKLGYIAKEGGDS